MSGLDDFFAKKDRKKKKSSSRTTITPPIETKTADVSPEEPLPKVTPPTSKPVDVDDGWIEIDDPRGSQVNTGGRTIVEFRRYVCHCDFRRTCNLPFFDLSNLQVSDNSNAPHSFRVKRCGGQRAEWRRYGADREV